MQSLFPYLTINIYYLKTSVSFIIVLMTCARVHITINFHPVSNTCCSIYIFFNVRLSFNHLKSGGLIFYFFYFYKKYCNRENFRLIVFDGFTCFNIQRLQKTCFYKIATRESATSYITHIFCAFSFKK